MNEINIIELDRIYVYCSICTTETPLSYSIPMYEGIKVDSTKTDDWIGMPVCQKCYDDDASMKKDIYA